jgi:CrcB protein
MQVFKQFMAIGFAGFLGALARYFVAKFLQGKFETSFPIGTLLVNLSGCFILGFFLAAIDGKLFNDQLRLSIAVGFVGAYTTFSTWMFESVKQLQDGHLNGAILNIVGSVLLGLTAIWLGAICGRQI